MCTIRLPCCKFRNENRFRFDPYIFDSFRSIMNECEICFRRTDSFAVKVRMTPFDYNSFFFSPNWCLKFIPNDSAPIRTKFSFRLNPFNSVKPFRMIPCHSPFSLNDSVPLRAQSEWFRRAFKRTGFRMIRKQISNLHGITRNRFHSEWVRKLHQGVHYHIIVYRKKYLCTKTLCTKELCVITLYTKFLIYLHVHNKFVHNKFVPNFTPKLGTPLLHDLPSISSSSKNKIIEIWALADCSNLFSR